MNLDRERLALQILENALSWPPAMREPRLQEQLANDPELLTEVRELLATAAAVDGSLPTQLPLAAVMEEGPPPERIGVYRLGELLGSGGMGRVYRADRADGIFEQTVAIKLMRRTALLGQVAEQFARERQILARLQHRNIAQLFDGGVTDDGHSYFIMELVEGLPVTQFTEQRKLSLRAMLDLFLQICAAVQYAHAHLVVHADIKPSNVVVTDGGVAKLLDFGVAHVLAQAQDEPAARPIGLTYHYSSPARRRGEPPSTADDVYSLGVVLDELLRLCRDVPMDLRAVARMAMADRPEARYASVDAFQEDLHRWLNLFPVKAHGAAWRYVMGRFLARHRLAMSITAIGTVLLIGAAIALAVLYAQAERAREKAEARFADVRSLSHFVLFDAYDRLETLPQALTLRRDFAEVGQRYLNRLAGDPQAPTEVRLEVIEGLRRLAQVQSAPGHASLAQSSAAKANLDRAEAMAKALPDAPSIRTRQAVLLSRIALARSQLASWRDQDFAASHRALDRASQMLERAARYAPDDPQVAALRLETALERAATLQWEGRYPESVNIAKDALARSAAALTSKSDRSAQLRHARLLDIYAESTYYAGGVAEAEQSYREQLALLQKLLSARPRDMGIARQVPRAGWALGTTLLELGRAEEAERVLAEARESAERLILLEPDDQELRRSVDIIGNAQSQALVALKRFDEAIPILERSVTERRRLWDSTPADWGLARDYTIALMTLADAKSDAGYQREACQDYATSLEMFGRLRAAGRLAKLDEDHALPLMHKRVARHCGGLR